MKVLALAVALCVFSSPAFAQGGGSYSQAEPGFPQPSLDMMEPGTVATARLPQLENVSFKQKLNAQLPLATHFRDENGRDVTLGQYFNGWEISIYWGTAQEFSSELSRRMGSTP